MDFVAAQARVDWMRPDGLVSFFYGNPNMNIGSFINMPVYDADFGWRRLIFVGIGFPLIDGEMLITHQTGLCRLWICDCNLGVGKKAYGSL